MKARRLIATLIAVLFIAGGAHALPNHLTCVATNPYSGATATFQLDKYSLRASNFVVRIYTTPTAFYILNSNQVPEVTTYRGRITEDPEAMVCGGVRANSSLWVRVTYGCRETDDLAIDPYENPITRRGWDVNVQLTNQVVTGNYVYVSATNSLLFITPPTNWYNNLGATNNFGGTPNMNNTVKLGLSVVRLVLPTTYAVLNDYYGSNIADTLIHLEANMNEVDMIHARDSGVSYIIMASGIEMYPTNLNDSSVWDNTANWYDWPTITAEMGGGVSYGWKTITDPEDMSGVVHCHEMSHNLGTPDWFGGYDYRGGWWHTTETGSGQGQALIGVFNAIYKRNYDANLNHTNWALYRTPLPPRANADYVSTLSGTPVNVDVLLNDRDANTTNRADLSIVSFQNPSERGGTVTNLGGGWLRYTPPAGFRGDDIFRYYVGDASGFKSLAGVRVLVADPLTPLVAQYQFEETNGTDTIDISGCKRTGTLVNTTFTSARVAGVSGNGVYLNGSTYLKFDRDASYSYDALNIGQSISIWFKVDEYTASEQILYSKCEFSGDYYGGPADADGVMVGIGTSVFARVKTFGPTAGIGRGNTITVNTSAQPQPHTWCHVVMEIDRTTHQLNVYVNGVLYAGTAGSILSNEFVIGQSPANLGMVNWAGSYFKGVMDDVRIYTKALTSAEVMNVYTNSCIIPASGPGPIDGAVSVSFNPRFTWVPGQTNYLNDVYLGTNYAQVYGATNGQPNLFKGRLSASAYTNGVSLLTNAVYYWRVDSVRNGVVGQKGEMWSFTTCSNGLFGDILLHLTFDDRDMLTNNVNQGTAYDIAGPPYENGTISNGAVMQAGQMGQSLNFNGASQFVDVPSVALNSDYATIIAWEYCTANPNNNGAGVVFSRSGNTIAGIRHRTDGTAANRRMLNYVWNGVEVQTTNTITLNTWNFEALVVSPSNGILYHGLVGPRRITTYVTNMTHLAEEFDGKTRVACDVGGAYNAANVDDVIIFRRALTPAEIYQIFTNGAAYGMSLDPTNTPKAGSFTWTGNSNNRLTNNLNWATNAVPGPNDSVLFDASSRKNLQPAMDRSMSLKAFNLESSFNYFFIGSGSDQSNGYTLTLGSGITVSNTPSPMNMDINVPIIMSGPQTWYVATNTTLDINNTIDNGGNTFYQGGGGVINQNGSISGSGGLTRDGGGTTWMNSWNFYGGTTLVQNGTLMLNRSSWYNGSDIGNSILYISTNGVAWWPSGPYHVFDAGGNNPIRIAGGKLTIDGGYYVNPSIEFWGGTMNGSGGIGTWGGGTLNLTTHASGTAALYALPWSFSGGTVGYYNLYVEDGTANPDFILSGPWSGTTLFKDGPGTMRVDSTNNLAGAITINAGRLSLSSPVAFSNNASAITIMNGGVLDVSAAAGFSVMRGQTLGGFGSVVGNTTFAQGTKILPGGTTGIGTLSFSNNFILSGGVELDYNLTNQTTAGGGINDMIFINGNLVMNGISTVRVDSVSGLTNGTYRLITYGGTRTGTAMTNLFLIYSVRCQAWLTNVAGMVNLVVTNAGMPANLVWQGGAGATWDIGATLNWLNSSVPAVFYNVDYATFDDSAAAYSVNIADTVMPNDPVTVNATSNYLFTGSGKISGLISLTKSGSGTLQIATTNDFAGSTTVNGGTLAISSDAALGTPPSTVSNGYLALGDATTLRAVATTTINANRNIAVGPASGGGNVAFNVDTNMTLYSESVINNNGTSSSGITKDGDGTMYIDNWNQYGGTTMVIRGTLVLNRSSWYQGSDIGSSILYITTNATVWWPSGPYHVFDAGGNNPIRIAGGTFTADGGFYINPSLEFWGGTVNGAGGLGHWNGATWYLVTHASGIPATWAISHGWAYGAGGNYNVTVEDGLANPDFILSGTWNGPGSTFVKNGAGTMRIDSTNCFDGPITINAGKLALTCPLAFSNLNSVITIASNAVLDVSGAAGYGLLPGQTLSGFGSIQGTIALNAGVFVTPGAAAAGTLSFSNDVTLNGATLAYTLVNNTAVGSGTNDLITVGGTLTLQNVSTVTVVTATGLTNGTYTLMTYNALVGGAANLKVLYNGRGGVIVTNNAGAKCIQMILSGAAANPIWRGGRNGATWDVQTTTNWVNGGVPDMFWQSDPATFDNTGATNPVVNIVTAVCPCIVTVNSASNYMFAGVGKISGYVSLTKGGSGTLLMSNANDFVGATVVNGGTVAIGADNGLGTPPGSYTANWLTLADGAGLRAYATFDQNANRGIGIGSAGVTGTVTLSADNGATMTNNVALTPVAGAVCGITKDGDGTVWFNADNPINSTATFNRGESDLNVVNWGSGSGGGMFNWQVVTINSGALVRTTAAHVFDYQGGGTLRVNGGTFRLGSGAYFSTIEMIGGTIDGGIGMSWVGNATVNSRAASTTALIANAFSVNGWWWGNGTVTYNVEDGAANPDLLMAAPLGGNLVYVYKNGAGSLVFSGTNSYTCLTTVNAGTIGLSGYGNNDASAGYTFATNTVFDVAGLATTFELKPSQSFGGYCSVKGNFMVDPGAGFVIGANGTPFTMAFSTNLTLISAALAFDLASPGAVGGGTNDLVAVGSKLDILGGVSTITVSFISGVLPGTYRLMTCGTLAGAASTNLYLAPITGTRYTYALSNTATQINLVVGGGVPNLTWRGGLNGAAWDVQTTSNWFNGTTIDTFWQSDSVTFDNSGATNPTVSIGVTVNAGSINVNSASNYTFSGAGSIATGSITKNGSGMLTIGTGNSFNGPVTVNGGILQPANATALGSAFGGTIIGTGATYDVNGINPGNEAFTVGGDGVGGNGAIINSGAVQMNAMAYLSLSTNASVGGANRWDVRNSGSAVNLNGYTLTKIGGNYVGIVQSYVGNGNMVVNGGTLYLQYGAVCTGNAGAITVNQGGTFGLADWGAAVNVTRPIAVNGGTLATESGAGGATCRSPITVNSNCTFQIDTWMWCNSNLYGSAAITKQGGEGFIVKADATGFTGSFTVAAGYLSLGYQDTWPQVTIGGSITNNSTLYITRNDACVLKPSIFGSGEVDLRTTVGLTISNTATINISGYMYVSQNYYAKLTLQPGAVVSAGAVKLGNPGNISGDLVQNGGTFTVLNNNGEDFVIGHWPGETSTYILSNGYASVAGSMSVGVDGCGQVYQNGGTVDAYRVVMDDRGNSGVADLYLLRGGILRPGAAGIIEGYGETGHQFEFILAGGTLGAQTSYSSYIPMTLSNIAANTIDTSTNAITLTGVLSGAGGFSKVGAGTLVIGGTVSASGAIFVTNGTILVDGTHTSAGACTVGIGSTIGGVGTYSGTVTVNGGLIPGDAGIGTLTVSNTVALSGTATTTMRIDRGASPTASKLVASGTITCGGTLVVTNIGATLVSGDSFDLFDGTLAGSFASVKFPALTGSQRWNTNSLYATGVIVVEDPGNDIANFSVSRGADYGQMTLGWSNGVVTVLACTNRSYSTNAAAWFVLTNSVNTPWIHTAASNYPSVYYKIVRSGVTSAYDVGKFDINIAAGSIAWLSFPFSVQPSCSDLAAWFGQQLEARDYSMFNFPSLQTQDSPGGAVQNSDYYVDDFGGFDTNWVPDNAVAANAGYVLFLPQNHGAVKLTGIGMVQTNSVTMQIPYNSVPWVGLAFDVSLDMRNSGLASLFTPPQLYSSFNYDYADSQEALGGTIWYAEYYINNWGSGSTNFFPSVAGADKLEAGKGYLLFFSTSRGAGTGTWTCTKPY